LPYQYHTRDTFISDANGALSFVVLPSVITDSIVPSVVLGNLCGPTALVPPRIPLLPGATDFRVVSVGLRLTNVAPALSASGLVSLRIFSVDDGVGIGTQYVGDTYLATDYLDVALSDCHDTCAVLPHNSHFPAETYTCITTPPTSILDWVACGNSPLTVTLLGGPPNVSCLTVEFIMNVEFFFAEGGALALAATPSPVSNLLVTQAAAAVTSTAKSLMISGAKLASDYIKKRALEALRSVLARNPYAGSALVAYSAIRSVD
jgi:hypothetical protein